LDKSGNVVAAARKPEPLKFKVTDQAQVDAAFKSPVDKFGRVDVVANNAGYGLPGVFEGLADTQIKRQMDVIFLVF